MRILSINVSEKELYEKFPWLEDAEIENAEIEVSSGSGELIWHDGTWHCGTWKSGLYIK